MANPTLQIGDNNWAIKESNLLGYSTIGTNFLPQPITMTRASAGTRVNSSGLVENLELLGPELITNGDFATDSNWAAASGWTVGVGHASNSGVSGNLQQNSILTSSKSYKITITVSSYVSGIVQVSAGGTPRSNVTANGTYTFYQVSSGTIFFIISAGGANAFHGSVTNISVKEVTRNNLARVNYDNTVSSLLAEPQRTNLFTYSNDYSQFPISNRLAITANNITSPDGTLNASKMQQIDGVTTAPNIAFSNVSSGTYTVSAFAKKGTRSFLAIAFNGTSYFDLQNGTITTTGSGHTASIKNLGNDWYRCSIVKTISTTQTAAFYFADTNNTLTTADDEGYMYLYGTQLEVGSYPTSYIPTIGSTVTRVADQYTKTGISNLINNVEGVLFVEIAAFSNDSTNRYIGLSDGSTNNRVNIFFDTNNILKAFVNGVSSSITSSATITNMNKVAVKYKSGDIALWINGVEIGTRSNSISLTGMDRLTLTVGSGSTTTFFGKVKQLQVFDTILTDAELATLTT